MHLSLGITMENDLSTKNYVMPRMLKNMLTKGKPDARKSLRCALSGHEFCLSPYKLPNYQNDDTRCNCWLTSTTRREYTICGKTVLVLIGWPQVEAE